MTVTRDRIPLTLTVGAGHYATPEWEYAAHGSLNDTAVYDVLERISQILQEHNDRPILVVFNEYFFF